MPHKEALTRYSGDIPTRIYRGDRAGFQTFDPRLRNIEQLNDMGCLYFALTFEDACSYTISKRRAANGARKYAVYECCFADIPRFAMFSTEKGARNFIASSGQDIGAQYRVSIAAMIENNYNGFIIVRESGSIGTELAIFSNLPIKILKTTELPDIINRSD